jgi:peptidoglycan/xylan/chitin deacetylase (PgdA/CDA1 family)
MAYAIPLVLHRLVQEQGRVHEDVSVRTFERMLSYIGSDWATLDPAMRVGEGRRWIITFDDGCASDVDLALPLLAGRGMRAVLFIVTSWIGRPSYLTWEQVRRLHASGMQIGSHSVTHPIMAALDPDARRDELIRSKRTLEDKIGSDVTSFAVPYGIASRDVIRDALAAGYDTCCTSRHGLAHLPGAIVPRNSITGRMSWPSVRRTLEASFVTRTRWAVEDVAKSKLKRVVGVAAYRAIRGAVFGTAR